MKIKSHVLVWLAFVLFTATSPGIAGFKAFKTVFNPKKQSTLVIKYELAQPATVSLEIFDRRGGLVKSLLNAERSAGTNQEVWDGTNSNGTAVASGIYVLVLNSSGNETEKRKIAIVK